MPILRPLLAVLCLALASPVTSQTVFDAMTGVFGSDRQSESCAVNPRTQSFSQDHRRIRMTWEIPVESNLGPGTIGVIEGTVVASDRTSITFLRDAETRTDAQGQPILWIYRLHDNGQGFCISQSDVAELDCLSSHTPCGGMLS
jgi:hypothetical protein